MRLKYADEDGDEYPSQRLALLDWVIAVFTMAQVVASSMENFFSTGRFLLKSAFNQEVDNFQFQDSVRKSIESIA